ncbi:MAG: hypothetical protein ACF8Q5_02440 [Phycisphaerales bacterium JB040]
MHLRWTVVLLVDVLSQRYLLDELEKSFSDTPSDCIPLLKETAGVVIGIRGAIRDFLSAIGTRNPLILEHIKTLPDGERELAQQTLDMSPRIQSFSDSIYVFEDVTDSTGQFERVSAAVSLLQAGAMACIYSLAGKKAIRGAIEIGVSINLPPENDLYGTGISKAHMLESEKAMWPRILVGPRILSLVSRAAERRPKSPIEELAVMQAKIGLDLITTSDDGMAMVDFLSDSFINEASVDSQMIESAFNHVISERYKFHSTGNHKLAARYDSLFDYVKRRLTPPPQPPPAPSAR